MDLEVEPFDYRHWTELLEDQLERVTQSGGGVMMVELANSVLLLKDLRAARAVYRNQVGA